VKGVRPGARRTVPISRLIADHPGRLAKALDLAVRMPYYCDHNNRDGHEAAA
jgi:hypothetical protein